VTRYEYNPDHQLVLVTRPDEGVIELKLEKSTGQLTAVDFQEGSVSLDYDAKTGLLSSANRDNTRVFYAYEGDLPTRTTWAGEVTGSVAHSYDKNFWVVSDQVTDHSAVSFGYDNDGLLVTAGSETLTRDAAQGFVTDTKLGSITDSMSYSSAGEPSAYSASASGNELLAQVFERDALGRVTQVTETTAGATHTLEYTYYPRGWLKSVKRDGAEEQSYEYDENGNRTTIQVDGKPLHAEFDAQDRLLSQGDVRFEYSLNGELTTKKDAAGTTSYSYDALGNLLSVTPPKGGQIDYVIDPAGRRVGKKLDGKLIKGFLYRSALQPVAELDGAGNVVSVLVYASRANVPDYLIRGTTTYRIISDMRGSPRIVINAATGAVAQRLDYDAWGNVTTDTSPGFQPFGFAGGLYDPGTGLVRFGARDYDASIGRWVGKDPILFGGRQTNFYVYVGNDPINAIDPSGLIAPLLAAMGTGAAVGGAAGGLAYFLKTDAGCRTLDGWIGNIAGGAIAGAGAPLVAIGLEAGFLGALVGTTGAIGAGFAGDVIRQASGGEVDYMLAASHGGLNALGAGVTAARLATGGGGIGLLTASAEGAVLGQLAGQTAKYFYDPIYSALK
jgi:RHS repeat-associated protein